MNKNLVIPAVILTATLSSCGTTGGSNLLSGLAAGAQQGQTQSGESLTGQQGTGLLGGLLSSLLGGAGTLSAESLAGTWSYSGTACVFESENLLAKAGGAVAAGKITQQLDEALQKAGINTGNISYTFNADGTYSAKLGSRTINGQYTLDAEAQTIQLTYLAGLGKTTSRIVRSGNTLRLLFEGSKLLQLLQGASALTGGASGSSTLSSLISSYDGLYIGLELQKK